jgi:hypothetical protein
MDKEYKKIEFDYIMDIDTAVSILLKYKENGILVYGEFNTHKLYSDTVTIDSAYKKITGKTKAEFDKERKEYEKLIKTKKEEHKEQIPELTKIWIEKGKKILSKDKIDYWKNIVSIRLRDLYRGMELGCCLDIIKILDNKYGSLEKAKEMLESQNHSGMSYGLVVAMVKEFSDKGNEFAEYIKPE